MSNSPLVNYKKLSPNCNSPRNHVIDTITIHCMAGNCTIEACGDIFANPARGASSNYGVGTDGRIALYCNEADRSWCTNSPANDHRAVTIEVANDQNCEPWHVSDKAMAALIDLCVDICKRNNIKKLLWKGDENLIGQVDKQNMTVHRWFAAKSCPGDYLYSKHGYIADEVNKRLGSYSASTGSSASQSTPAASAAPSTGNVKFSVGDIVNFSGGSVYVSANAASTTVVKAASKVKITSVYSSGKHPYHAISEDKAGVYGWVDASALSAGNSDFKPYEVRITAETLNYRSGAGTNYPIKGTIKKGEVYTIVGEASGAGASKWGQLKSGAGWISLDYTVKK